MLDPFGERRHRELARKVRVFGDTHLRARVHDEADPEGGLRELAGLLAAEQLLGPAVLPPYGSMDLRSVAVIREGLAYFSSLADAAFATQGLGSYAVSLAGTDSQKDRWLPAAVSGDVLCCLALTEPEAGSDLGGIRTLAEADGALWRLSGVKTFISNAAPAGMYNVLARSSSARGTTGLSMFLVDADAPGIGVKPLEPMASFPVGEIRFDATPAVLLGGAGKGYALAMATLDTFRPSLGAAACGLAARALDEAVSWSLSRRQFGQRLADFQATQLAIAEMYADLAGARLLVWQAAWTKDSGAARITREGAVAKLVASEMAQRVVDRAVQLHGGQGLMRGATVERLYRDVRSLRVCQGTSEILKLVITKQILKESR
jgi:acyl-CoA dehydrogenase